MNEGDKFMWAIFIAENLFLLTFKIFHGNAIWQGYISVPHICVSISHCVVSIYAQQKYCWYNDGYYSLNMLVSYCQTWLSDSFRSYRHLNASLNLRFNFLPLWVNYSPQKLFVDFALPLYEIRLWDHLLLF